MDFTQIAHKRIGTPIIPGTKITVTHPLKQYLIKATSECRSEVEKRNIGTLGKV